MKIALASQNRRTLTAHAGKCRHFFVVDTAAEGAPQSVNLSPAESLSVWSGEGAHPLADVDVLVAATLGSGVAAKLARRGIQVVATPEREPARIVAGLLDGSLPREAIRTEADARSQPGSCLPDRPESPASKLILGGWSSKH